MIDPRHSRFNQINMSDRNYQMKIALLSVIKYLIYSFTEIVRSIRNKKRLDEDIQVERNKKISNTFISLVIIIDYSSVVKSEIDLSTVIMQVDLESKSVKSTVTTLTQSKKEAK